MTYRIAVVIACIVAAPAAEAAQWDFAPQELPTRLGVGYAVRLIDMNGDGQRDIVVVDKTRLVWLENSSWQEHPFAEGETKPDNVCFAPADIDGDGRLDFALGADWTLNTNEGGTVQWLKGPAQPDQPWKVIPITTEPTVHRMQFVDLDGDGREELVVAPLLGQGTTRPHFAENGVRILALEIPEDPAGDPWPEQVITDQLHVTHNFYPCDLDQDQKVDLLVASFEGVFWLRRQGDGSWGLTQIGEGNQETSPNRGASEVKLGRLADGSWYVATIEPWHGHQVVVYRPAGDNLEHMWERHVIDEQLKWGHAVWCADLDGDADEELIIGVRDTLSDENPCGLRIYDPQGEDPGQWQRTMVDPGGVNIEDLAVGDLDGDGRQDIVAVGRQSHNVKIYWNRTRP